MNRLVCELFIEADAAYTKSLLAKWVNADSTIECIPPASEAASVQLTGTDAKIFAPEWKLLSIIQKIYSMIPNPTDCRDCHLLTL